MITHTIQAKRLKALAKKKKALWASSPQVARAIEEGDLVHLRAIHQLREHDFTFMTSTPVQYPTLHTLPGHV